jgi:hypothetical protein
MALERMPDVAVTRGGGQRSDAPSVEGSSNGRPSLHGAISRERSAYETTAVRAVGLIPSLRGSLLHGTCVEIYQRHRGDATGLCDWCGYAWPCPPRIHAAEVIETVGKDFCRYDHQQAGRDPVAGAVGGQGDRRPVAQVLSATVTGYALGGVNRRPVAAGNWAR